MEIGNKILELRKKQHMSQEQLAEKLNVTRQTISKWELGETSPDLVQAKKLSQIFNVSLDELTNNELKDILITKISNTERLAGIIIKILKGMGIILILTIIVTIFIILSRKYYEVKPNNMVSDSYGVYCIIDGKKYYFEAGTTRDTPKIEFYTSYDITLKDMNININKYKSKENLIKDVKKYIISKGGTCNQ